MKELQTMAEVELLQLHGAVIYELIRRGVVRTKNNPIGDYTEWLVCDRLGLLPVESKAQAAFDATDRQGCTRYQIKGRRSEANSVQFSAIRNLEEQGFDFVIAVIFNEDYSVRLAVKIPHEKVVPPLAKYREHVNGHILIVPRNAAEQDGVEDISQLLV